MGSFTLLLSSAGRRPYLIEWFQSALTRSNVDGRIVVVDSDPDAPARSVAETFLVAPSVVSKDYDYWLTNMLAKEGVDLAVSLNDFELSRWSRLGSEFVGADSLVRLHPDLHRVVEDKLLMSTTLREHGVKVPDTVTASEALGRCHLSDERELVTKGRYGSASRGLRMATGADLPGVVSSAVREVTDASGLLAASTGPSSLDLLIVQDRIRGQEYGLDVVSNMCGEHVAILARRKISMRAGETDRAVSVDPAPFEELGRQLSKAIPHRGSIDVDVLVDSDGTAWVIDVNPRFGGGYPFSHLAGADLPAAYLAWMMGEAPDESWFASTPGVTSSKYVGIARCQ